MQRTKALWAISIGCAVLGILCVNAAMGGTREMGYHFLWLIACAACAWLGHGFWRDAEKRERRVFGVLGALFAGAQTLGLRLETADQTGIQGILICLGAAIGLMPAAGALFWRLYRGLRSLSARQTDGRLNEKNVLWIAFGCIFLCWLPALAAFFPGISAYDIFTQMDEVLSGSFTNRNPLLHTLVMGGFYRLGRALGSIPLGYALFMLLQMAVMALSFAAVVRYLWTLKAPRVLTGAALVLFMLLPIHALLSISDTKDGFFAAFMALLLIRLHRLTQKPELMKERRFVLEVGALGILMCMMRNNAFAGLVIGAIVGFFLLERAWRKRFLVLMLATFIGYFGVMNGLKAVMGASGSLATELVSVQSQQMGRVYALYQDTEPDDCAEIATWLPTVTDYTPHTADPLKTFAIVNRPERMWSFLKLWGRVGLHHPVEYLDAWLLNTKGYWYLNDDTHARIYGMDETRGYLLTGGAEQLGLSQQSLLPALQTLYTRLFVQNEYQSIPVLSLLFSPALWLWLCAFSFASALCARDRHTCILLAVLCGSFLPLLFGACVLIRYVYAFVALMPLILGCVWHQQQRA